jgi:hypothetical protein
MAMDKNYVILAGGPEKIEEQARELVSNTLAPLDSQISMVAVRVTHDGTAAEPEFEYGCTILIRLLNGAIVRSTGRDCDEMLAIYEALSKTIDVLVQTDPSMSQRLLSGEYR